MYLFSSQTAGFCAGSVHGDLNVHPDVQVSCEMFKVQVQEAVQKYLASELDLLSSRFSHMKNLPFVFWCLVVKNMLLYEPKHTSYL